MNSDEIRRLAEPLCKDRAVSVYNESLDEFVADGCVTLKYRDALLAYAGMVKRCEMIRRHFAMTKTESEMLDYILCDDAGKEGK